MVEMLSTLSSSSSVHTVNLGLSTSASECPADEEVPDFLQHLSTSRVLHLLPSSTIRLDLANSHDFPLPYIADFLSSPACPNLKTLTLPTEYFHLRAAEKEAMRAAQYFHSEVVKELLRRARGGEDDPAELADKWQQAEEDLQRAVEEVRDPLCTSIAEACTRRGMDSWWE